MAHTDESVREHTSAGPAPADPLPSIATPDVPIGGGGLTAESVLALQRSAGNQGVARMLSQVQARGSLQLGRCPDGSCAGACACDEHDEDVPERSAESDAVVTARHARAKSLGDGVDRVEAPGNAPVDVVIELVPEDAAADEASQEGAEATAEPADAGARQKRGASAPVEVSVAQVQPGPARSGSGLALRSKATTSVMGGAAPTHAMDPTDYGLTIEEAIIPTIGAKKVPSWFGSWFGSYWYPVVTSLAGSFSQQVRLLPGPPKQDEVTGPAGNTTNTNFCKQVEGLKTLGNTIGNPWYMLQAVKDHEDVHAAHFGPGLQAAEPAITAALEAVSIPDAAGMTQATAAKALAADATFKAAVKAALQTWIAQDNTLLAGDHAPGGPTDTAEHKVVDPMITSICAHAETETWGACADCPP